MKRRVITGLCASSVAIIMAVSGKEIFDLGCSLLAAIAVYEVFEAFRARGFKPAYFAGYTACLCLFLGSIEYWDRRVWRWLHRIILFVDIRILLYLSLLMMFFFLITGIGKYSVSDLAVTILGTFYICFLFWYLIMARNLHAGEYAVWFVVFGAVATDIAAYFIGTYFGRHKLIPEISPKKTVEGAAAGALACVLVIVLYGVFVFDRFGYKNALWQYAIMGAMCGIVAQIGDLAASCLKRYCGIKDFGKILPGHGGILDRMDSIILISPLVYLLLTVFEKV